MKLSAIKNSSILALIPHFHLSHQPISKVCENENFKHSEFLAAITHELKTPLSAIQSFADVLQEDLLSPNSKEDCLSHVTEIKQIAADMSELIHDILDVSQVSSGNFSVNTDNQIDISDVIKRAVRLNRDYSLRRHVALKVEIADYVKMVKLDAKRMKQVMTNLISNAIKYSPEKTEVKIICKNNGNFLEISVADQGFGMTDLQVATAFEKYKTIQNPNSDKVDSFGLGLPITKSLIELQNGRIEVDSKIGEGTEIKLKFPLNLL
jgi:two-component system, cell cycle sensor histidine kinase PleC